MKGIALDDGVGNFQGKNDYSKNHCKSGNQGDFDYNCHEESSARSGLKAARIPHGASHKIPEEFTINQAKEGSPYCINGGSDGGEPCVLVPNEVAHVKSPKSSREKEWKGCSGAEKNWKQETGNSNPSTKKTILFLIISCNSPVIESLVYWFFSFGFVFVFLFSGGVI